ncbi:uncharacterized protein LOC143267772 isoform X2 [Peromyscus maniculatus bairdii]|uniref:uncharacterized protein LOC143267772 isoform X2 n=1 Tax=Peromyscus maniculatus bairdii TaxID=230844 RepID=UPI003FD515AA
MDSLWKTKTSNISLLSSLSSCTQDKKFPSRQAPLRGVRIRGDTCMYKKGNLMSRDRHERQSSLTSSVPLCLPSGSMELLSGVSEGSLGKTRKNDGATGQGHEGKLCEGGSLLRAGETTVGKTLEERRLSFGSQNPSFKKHTSLMKCSQHKTENNICIAR